MFSEKQNITFPKLVFKENISKV